MKLSVVVFSHNESTFDVTMSELVRSLKKVPFKWEIINIDDDSDGPIVKHTISRMKATLRTKFKSVKSAFEGDFAAHKNTMFDHVSGDWILQLDGDEQAPVRLDVFEAITKKNSDADVIYLPRANTVEGITLDDLLRYGWKVEVTKKRKVMNIPGSEKYNRLLMQSGAWINDQWSWEMLVNWPDFQGRLIKANTTARWTGKVHERLTMGAKTRVLPARREFAIEHHKTIGRQREQNKLYEEMT